MPLDEPPSSGSGRRILIVEDEPLIAWSLADMAEALGYDVIGPVATEREAVDEATRQQPDAILMDLRLSGGGSGLAAAREIRTAAQTPIIFCTAYAGEKGLRDEMMAVARSALITKPVQRSQLQQALAAALDG
ncbi:MAG: response regulator [Alphaproteobacteria bacterium]|nr:response regulator [Alphaproteobacteria bacterium]MCW5739240.1 response regulator [Alphaproteobacteria bacterium]